MIQLRAQRDFGEVLGDSFDFFKQNIGVYFKGFILYIMPLAILSTLCMMQLFDILLSGFNVTGDIPEMSNSELVKNIIYGALAFFTYMAAILMVYVLNYAIYSSYNATDGDFVWEDVSDYIKKHTLKVFGNFIVIYILLFLCYILLFLPMVISPYFAFISVFAGMFVLVYVLMKLIVAPYVYIEENLSIFDSFKRSFELTRDNWWSIFGLVFVAAIVAGFISAFFRIPLYIVMGFSSFSALDSGDVTIMSKVMLALSGAIAVISNLFMSIYPAIIVTMKYSDLIEQKEGSSLADKIDDFGEREDRFFENEGEY